MDGKNKFIAGLVLGVAAGAAAALFLQSGKGKEMINTVKDAAGDAEAKLKSRLQKFDEEISELLRKGKQFVEDLEKKAKNAGSSA
jgi:gas vesicle protein